MDSLVALGEQLKLSGKDLTEFVREQQKIAREIMLLKELRGERKKKEQNIKEKNKQQKLLKEQEFDLRPREFAHLHKKP